MPKHLSKIPLVRATDGVALPMNSFEDVVLSSIRTSWQSLVVEQHHWSNGACEVNEDVQYMQHVIAVNIGRRVTAQYRKDGRFQHVTKSKGSISLFPSQQPFFRRVESGQNGASDFLFLALDPVLVTRAGADLEGYPDRVELIEQQGQVDPALRHIAMALRAGLQTGRSGERMYGESLAMALAIHLLRKYAVKPVEPPIAPGGLSREKLMRAVNYIEDQLDEDLTVAEIARAVYMSPYHFSRLFKKATGQSPYRYVIEARAKRAKALLKSRKFSISEVAYQVGFADQSHLTYHIKKFYGLTPKMLLESYT
jgi:AraC family transcriptional regulator